MSVYDKLMKVQQELKAPKSNFNSFGKYKYRSAEDILEAVKPLLAKYKATMFITDDIRAIEGRFYLEATITFVDTETSEKVVVKALAREQEDKKGMDPAQLTGAVSSYARKYALSGMFAIDDTKDMDTMNNSSEGQQGRNPGQQSRSNTSGQQSSNLLNSPRCSVCGGVVERKVANYSLNKFGKVLCIKDQGGK